MSKLFLRPTSVSILVFLIVVALSSNDRRCLSASIASPSTETAEIASGPSILSRYPRAFPVKVFRKFDQAYRSGKWDSLDLSTIHAGYDLGMPVGCVNRCPVTYTPSATVFGRSSRRFLENGIAALRGVDLDAFNAREERIEWSMQNFRWSLLCADYDHDPELSALSLIYLGFACYLEGKDTDGQGFLNGARNLMDSSLQQYDERRLTVLMQLSSIYHELNAYEAEHECLNLLIPVVQKVRSATCDLLATVLNRKGNACYWSAQSDAASREYKKSLAILDSAHPNLAPLVRANLQRVSPASASISPQAVSSAAQDLAQIGSGTNSGIMQEPSVELSKITVKGQPIADQEDRSQLSLEYVQALALLWNLEDLKQDSVRKVLELTHSLHHDPSIPISLKTPLLHKGVTQFPRRDESKQCHPWLQLAAFCAESGKLGAPVNEELTGVLTSTLSQSKRESMKQHDRKNFELLQKLALEYQCKLDDSTGGGYCTTIARTDLNPDCTGCSYIESLRSKIASHLHKSRPIARVKVGLRIQPNGKLDRIGIDDHDVDLESAQSALVAILSCMPFDRFPNKSLDHHTDNDNCLSLLLDMSAQIPANEIAEWTATAYQRDIERRVKARLSPQFSLWLKQKKNELTIEIDRNGRMVKLSSKGAPLPADDAKRLSEVYGLPAAPGSVLTPTKVSFWR